MICVYEMRLATEGSGIIGLAIYMRKELSWAACKSKNSGVQLMKNKCLDYRNKRRMSHYFKFIQSRTYSQTCGKNLLLILLCYFIFVVNYTYIQQTYPQKYVRNIYWEEKSWPWWRQFRNEDAWIVAFQLSFSLLTWSQAPS